MARHRKFVDPARCRECHGIVRTFEDVCPHCGVDSPVRLSGWTGYAVLGLLALNVLLLCL